MSLYLGQKSQLNRFKLHKTSVTAAGGGYLSADSLHHIPRIILLLMTPLGDHTRVGPTEAEEPLSLESLKYLPMDVVWFGRLGFPPLQPCYELWL